MSSSTQTPHNAHRDLSGEYSELLAYPARFRINPREAKNHEFKMSEHQKDFEACLNVANLEHVANGGFGEVFKCSDQEDSERQFAIKILKAEYAGPKYMAYWTGMTKCEISFLKNLNHPNILKYVDHCWLDSDKVKRSYVALKTELMDCTLEDHLMALKGPMDYDEFKRLFTQIASALVHMHEKGVAHLDIKGCNIMMNKSKDWKILDFGHSHYYAGPKEQALEYNFFQGTLLFNCPCKRSQVPYNPFHSDPYSFGMVLWQCIQGIENVFCDKNDETFALTMPPAWTIINESVWPKLEEDGQIGPHHLVALMLVAPLEERIFVSDALEMFEWEDMMRLEDTRSLQQQESKR